MAFNSNGQIQYLILDSLSNGSKYGLEIIEFISQKTNGNYIMKKPTLYSCLTRMEKKGLVSSSFWGDSDLGGKRHYYSITPQGEKSLEELSSEFENEYSQDSTTLSDSKDTNETKPMFLQQDNLFDMVKPTDEKQNVEQTTENEETDVIENQIDMFNYNPIVEEADTPQNNNEDLEKMQYYQNILEQSSTKEESTEIKDDAKFLEKDEQVSLTAYQEAQNKKLYDTSSELKKYRNKKSFSENQIEMSVVYEKAEDREIQKAIIEQLKQSILNARNNSYNQIKENEEETLQQEEQDVFSPEQSLNNEKVAEELKDDAIFITHPRIDEKDMPIQKKITPPNIEVNIYDDNLPAPKRDSKLEPTYKDMMAKLFERKKEKNKEAFVSQPEEIPATTYTEKIANYDSLKKYYAGHGIEFKEYKKTSVERRHNTNFLTFISSTILLLLSGIGSSVLFWIANSLNLLKNSTNFMFYTLPILFLIYSIFCFIRFKAYPSKKPTLIYNSIVNWAVFIFGTVIVFIINIICGMQYETMSQFLTSLVLPIWSLLIVFPINYYIKKILFNKFGK